MTNRVPISQSALQRCLFTTLPPLHERMTERRETRKGRVIETRLEDDEALAMCAELANAGHTFAYDLVEKSRRWNLSPDQVTWLHIIASEYLEAAEAPLPAVELGAYPNIGRLMQKVETNTKNASFSILLATDDGNYLRFYRKRGATVIHVSDGGEWSDRVMYGKLRVWGGDFEPSRNPLPEATRRLMKAFDENPEEVAAKHGAKTGRCCFCNTELTDERSVAVGYGKICAQNYGLTWGAR